MINFSLFYAVWFNFYSQLSLLSPTYVAFLPASFTGIFFSFSSFLFFLLHMLLSYQLPIQEFIFISPGLLFFLLPISCSKLSSVFSQISLSSPSYLCTGTLPAFSVLSQLSLSSPSFLCPLPAFLVLSQLSLSSPSYLCSLPAFSVLSQFSLFLVYGVKISQLSISPVRSPFLAFQCLSFPSFLLKLCPTFSPFLIFTVFFVLMIILFPNSSPQSTNFHVIG